MYPPSAPVRERWFWPEKRPGSSAHRFEQVEISHLLMPEEADFDSLRALALDRAGLSLWTARKPGDGDV